MAEKSDTRREAEALAPQLVAWRRHLHAHPELSGQEQQTAAWVAAELRKLGIEPRERVGDTWGLTADLGAGRGPAVALRADMDALPIVEENAVDYASRNRGVMHACGHDAHTAMLLGAAAILNRRREVLKRPVRLIFQPAEEVFPGGAAPMIRGGAMEGVGSVFGLHITSQLPLGILGTRVGPFMAAVNTLRIAVRGRGGHAAMPESCVDPIVVAAHVVTALQTIVSRSLSLTEQAVVSVTRIAAGSADNVIPETVEMTGTIRTFNPAVQARVHARVREIATQVAAAFNASARVEIDPGYPVLCNDAAATEQAFTAAKRVGFAEAQLQTVDPMGGGEDFAYYGANAPASFVFLGARNEASGCSFPHHHPRFNIDEAALPAGAALLAQFALDAGSP